MASTVVTAALQRAVDDAGRTRFLLKGGTMLQYRLPGMSRTTQDLDGLVTGDLDSFIQQVDDALEEPWGPLALNRGHVETINVPYKVAKPRRFDVVATLNGVTWRRIQVEISPDEGLAGAVAEELPPPSLAGFGLPTPDRLVSLTMRYQVAQKVHAATDPHDPPEFRNDRPRDVVDLLLMRDLITRTREPSLASIREAITDIFAARAAEAEALGRPGMPWPARLTAYPHWEVGFTKSAGQAGLRLTMEEAISQVNAWLDGIDLA
ncbi:MAG: nucleotidyl transferase AbiEii/AbiGii toxin family protein [Propionibacteriaceae bacterium]|nr:nucleotidyl transferase AbiEii/AbiGii toxin family protein [Propionibacteriaceae bacterium]